MERTVEVATGESVAFSYELAGLGSRFFALFIDIVIQLAVAAAGVFLFAWLSGANTGVSGQHLPFAKLGHAVAIALASFAVFVLFFAYFIVFEWRWAGRTPGKRLLGIRVVRDGGFPLDFTSAVVRNVVRILEFGLGFYAISAVAMLVSPANRRLGDMAAGTLVVRDHRFERTNSVVPVDARRRVDADGDLVGALSQAQRDLVRRYVARRPTLGAQARAAIAAQIGAAVRPKLTASFAHLDDDDLLVHIAATALGAGP